MHGRATLAGVLSIALLACGGRASTKAPDVKDAAAPSAEPAPAAAQPVTYADTPQFDALIDLLPEGTDVFMIATSIDHLVALSDAVRIPWHAAARRFASKNSGKDLEPAFEAWQTLTSALSSSEIEVERGMAVVDVDDHTFVLYAAQDPAALPRLLGATVWGQELASAACRPIPERPPWVVCAGSESLLATYAPGRQIADDVRARLTERFPEEAGSAAVLAQFDRGKPSEAMMVMQADGAVVQAWLDAPVPDDKTAQVFGRGPAPLLASLAPTDTFAWGRMGPELLKAPRGGEDLMNQALLGSLTGEFYMGGISGTSGVALLLGLQQADPVRGLLTLLGGQLGTLEKTLEDVVPLQLTSKVIAANGVDLPVVHAKLVDRAQIKAYAKLGVAAEAWMFAADEFAGVALGVTQKELGALMGRRLTEAAAEPLQGVPALLVDRAHADALSVAVHWAFDALQSPRMAQSLSSLLAHGPSISPVEGWTHEEVVDLLQSTLTPFSSLSVWLSPPGPRMRVGTHLRLWVDPRTEVGQGALAAFARPMAVKARAKAYRTLAQRSADAPEAAIYRVRAGDAGSTAMSSAIVIGVFAGIVVAALQRYTERVKASLPGGAAPPSPP